MALIDDLGSGPIGIDTAIFIYFIEENPRFLAAVAPVFIAADAGKLELIVSGLTLLEVLVVPYRAGNTALAQRYETMLTRSRGVRMIDLTRTHFRLAAQLRAGSNAATPDAIQLAVSLSAGCTAFLTNDRRLPVVPGLKIVQLTGYAG
ncbi:MAG TPA: PIN domain-containing protein [Reyranella sp.]|jgi:predicted nucleic acid-binding protein